MWTCPECQAEFVQKNSSHSCIKSSLEDFLKDKSSRSRELFQYFLNEFQKIGPFKLHPVKTRIALMVEVRFCAINRFTQNYIDGHLWLKQRIDSKKFYKIQPLGPSDYIHHFRINDVNFIDDEFRKYMSKAYEIGQRKYISAGKSQKKKK
jgi:hypothetical protein